jgi:hypothetical protein
MLCIGLNEKVGFDYEQRWCPSNMAATAAILDLVSVNYLKNVLTQMRKKLQFHNNPLRLVRHAMDWAQLEVGFDKQRCCTSKMATTAAILDLVSASIISGTP